MTSVIASPVVIDKAPKQGLWHRQIWMVPTISIWLPSTIAAAAEEIAKRVLIVGTKEAPPFAMKNTDGVWTGISIDLWHEVAGQLKLPYRFAEAASVDAMLDGVTKGQFDVAIAAISVTAAREQVVDFSTPYFYTGVGVAVPIDRVASWLPVFRSIMSVGFLQAVLALLGLALLMGVLIWTLERRANEGFGGTIAHGVGSGVWWSTAAMTQRVVAGAVPSTTAGRVVAVVWMIASIVAVAIFTAGLTSTLTTRRLHGVIASRGDLVSLRVGVVRGTSSVETIIRMRIRHSSFETPQQAFEALREGQIDAFAYDRPILAWRIGQGGTSAELTDVVLDPQSYAIALPPGSPLRKQINVALLEAERSDWWKDTVFRHLGQ